MEKGLVSIVIPCYNASSYLDKCLNSLLNQTYKKIEVIIINDGSIDDSECIIDKYISFFKKNKMKLIKINQDNLGQAAAVNNGLKYVHGEYLMWQDSDDWYELDAVENLFSFINEHDYNLVRGEAVTRKNENINEVYCFRKSNFPNDLNIFDKYIFETDSYMFVGVFMCRMKHFDSRIKGREIYESRAGQNWQLILPISYKEKCGYLNKIVYNYRISESSHYHSVKKTKDLLRRCDDHKDILLNVLKNVGMTKKEYISYRKKISAKYIRRKIGIILASFRRNDTTN